MTFKKCFNYIRFLLRSLNFIKITLNSIISSFFYKCLMFILRINYLFHFTFFMTIICSDKKFRFSKYILSPFFIFYGFIFFLWLWFFFLKLCFLFLNLNLLLFSFIFAFFNRTLFLIFLFDWFFKFRKLLF